MFVFSKKSVRQVIKWKDRVSYHSGLGVFGHRPREVNESEISPEILSKRNENCRAHRLVEAYRTYGHLRASIDNVDYKHDNRNIQELDISKYGLSQADVVDASLLYGYNGKQSAGDLVQLLEEIYCVPISYEFSYLETEAEREWFAERIESGADTIDKTRKIEILTELLNSQCWDKFLSVKYPTVKRYCGEGGESLQSFFSTLFRLTTSENVKHVVLAMAHRGKLNALSGLLNYPPVKIFHKFNGNPEFPEEANAVCDISTHLMAPLWARHRCQCHCCFIKGHAGVVRSVEALPLLDQPDCYLLRIKYSSPPEEDRTEASSPEPEDHTKKLSPYL